VLVILLIPETQRLQYYSSADKALGRPQYIAGRIEKKRNRRIIDYVLRAEGESRLAGLVLRR
jgi:hypothetical protein